MFTVTCQVDVGILISQTRKVHSSILAWEIPWTEEPGRLQARGVCWGAESDVTEPLLLRKAPPGGHYQK